MAASPPTPNLQTSLYQTGQLGYFCSRWSQSQDPSFGPKVSRLPWPDSPDRWPHRFAHNDCNWEWFVDNIRVEQKLYRPLPEIETISKSRYTTTKITFEPSWEKGTQQILWSPSPMSCHSPSPSYEHNCVVQMPTWAYNWRVHPGMHASEVLLFDTQKPMGWLVQQDDQLPKTSHHVALSQKCSVSIVDLQRRPPDP